ncbi:MAG: thioredoxin domain-containing protein [Nanoarchaeota archaeon]
MEENNKVEHAAKPQKSGDAFWKITTVVLIVVLAVVAFRGNSGPGAAPTGGAVLPSAGDNPAPTIVDMEKLLDDDTVKGDEDAPVTIVEWSDYECPFCERFYSETEKLINEQYVKTGKVKFVYRDFPLSFHANAQKAAEAAECAGEQEKYWEMHDKIFESGVQGGVTGFKQYAKELGLNSAKFDTCLDSGAMAKEIQQDMADGAAVGIQGTPGFIVNGKLVSGAQPFAVFKQVIDAELN